MSGFLSTLRNEFADREFRRNYVAENTRRGVAYQIKALRESRGWSAAELARQAGKPQSNIHRWEDPTYGKFSLSTLIEIASIFDVGLVVRFVGFNTLLDTVADLRPATLAIPSYDDDIAIAERKSVSGGAMAAFYRPVEQTMGRSVFDEIKSEEIKFATLPPGEREKRSSALKVPAGFPEPPKVYAGTP